MMTQTRRRLRANAHIRALTATVRVAHQEMIQPLFVEEGLSDRVESQTLTGVFTDTETSVLAQIAADIKCGVHKFLLFPIPAERFEADFDFRFAQRIVARIKAEFGHQVWLAMDLCLCSYTTHGHCGILNPARTKLDNAPTVKILADYALILAEAGADCIAPSDMMDGRIKAIRKKLDHSGFDDVAIMSYSTKFSSNFYGPFRDVCKSTPKSDLALKDRKTYQLDPRNLNDALATSFRDLKEGADMLMVKPALPYLDVVSRLSTAVHAPVVVYHVSGEYSAIELLAKARLIDRRAAHLEIWTAFKRAGASAIITYAARNAEKWLQEQDFET
jgi:porphobilinogen synthase